MFRSTLCEILMCTRVSINDATDILKRGPLLNLWYLNNVFRETFTWNEFSTKLDMTEDCGNFVFALLQQCRQYRNQSILPVVYTKKEDETEKTSLEKFSYNYS